MTDSAAVVALLTLDAVAGHVAEATARVAGLRTATGGSVTTGSVALGALVRKMGRFFLRQECQVPIQMLQLIMVSNIYDVLSLAQGQEVPLKQL
jgi:hypothetical protein